MLELGRPLCLGLLLRGYPRLRLQLRSSYRLQVSGYSGNTDRDTWAEHNGMEFSTMDRDNDRWSESCSQSYNMLTGIITVMV